MKRRKRRRLSYLDQTANVIISKITTKKSMPDFLTRTNSLQGVIPSISIRLDFLSIRKPSVAFVGRRRRRGRRAAL